MVIYPDSHLVERSSYFLDRAASTEGLENLLQRFDTGIESIVKGKQLAEKTFAYLPDEIKDDIMNELEQHREDIRQNGSVKYVVNENQFVISLENDEFVAEKIMLNHGNSSELFELDDESDGTKRLFDLIPLYEFGQKDRIIFVDELDRSFHSKLTQEFIRMFYEATENQRSQIICTTHDLNLLDLSFVRQDEIWFVEREPDHSSRIYSLSDYKERFDKNILNDYLLGRYGAIPCFQDSEWQVDPE